MSPTSPIDIHVDLNNPDNLMQAIEEKAPEIVRQYGDLERVFISVNGRRSFPIYIETLRTLAAFADPASA